LKSSVINSRWKEYIEGHLNDDPFSLSLESTKERDTERLEAIRQIQARQKALKKLPGFAYNFDLIFPPPVSVEQASSEWTARFKSLLFSGKSCADLTGGMGIDAFYLSENFEKVDYVEQDRQLCEIARHNFDQLNKRNVSVTVGSTEDFLRSNKIYYDLIYLDPSRRGVGNKRLFKLEECLPNVVDLEDLLMKQAQRVLIKLSPLADLKHLFAQLAHLKNIWVVSVKNECKEILCELNDSGCNDKVHAISLEDGHADSLSFDFKEEENTNVSYAYPDRFLYEPNSSLLKAGAFKTAANRYGVSKLHIHSHLYTSDKQIDFPGRTFRLIKWLQPDKKVLKREIGSRKVNVIARNFPLKPDEIIKKFNLTPGEDLYLIATTLMDQKRVIILCERIK